MPSRRPKHCLVCGRPLDQKTRGRIRRYCSDACRQKAFRLRQKRWPNAEVNDSEGPTSSRVEVIYCPEELFPHGTFSWLDFQASLGIWPDGMQVTYQGQYYEVQAAQLQPIPAQRVKASKNGVDEP